MMDETSSDVSPWAVVWHWAMAALFSSIVPFLLLLFYQHSQWAREILNMGQDKNVFIPILGWTGYRFRGQALWFTLVTVVMYGGVGIWLFIKNGSLSKNRSLRFIVSEVFFSLAVALMFLVIPMLSICWAIAFTRNAIPMGIWGEYAGNHGCWYRVYDLRYIMNRAFEMPTLGLLSGIVSFLVRFSIRALLASAANICMFCLLLLTHYWLVD